MAVLKKWLLAMCDGTQSITLAQDNFPSLSMVQGKSKRLDAHGSDHATHPDPYCQVHSVIKDWVHYSKATASGILWKKKLQNPVLVSKWRISKFCS